MARKYGIRYEPIRLEAQQPNGEWRVRNAFIFQNAEVQSGEKSRAWLIAYAYRVLVNWRGFDSDRPLRVTGQGSHNGGEYA